MVLFEDQEHGLRLVQVGASVLVEVPDGRDSTGRARWQRARVIPERRVDVVLEGWKAIMEALGVSKLDSAQRYARRNVDPLPVRFNHQGKVWIFESILRAWVASNTMSGKHRYVATSSRRRP